MGSRDQRANAAKCKLRMRVSRTFGPPRTASIRIRLGFRRPPHQSSIGHGPETRSTLPKECRCPLSDGPSCSVAVGRVAV